MPLILAIDYDRTIVDTDNIPEGKKLGDPLPDAVESIRILHEAGHKIIIHSCRSSDGPRADKVMTDYLDAYGIPYDEVWNKVGKPKADCYLDDLGLRFTSWSKAMEDIRELN